MDVGKEHHLVSIDEFSSNLGMWIAHQPEHTSPMRAFDEYQASVDAGHEDAQSLIKQLYALDGCVKQLLLIPDYTRVRKNTSNVVGMPNSQLAEVGGPLLQGKEYDWLDVTKLNGTTDFHKIMFELSAVEHAVKHYAAEAERICSSTNLTNDQRLELLAATQAYSLSVHKAVAPLDDAVALARWQLENYVETHEHLLQDPDASEDEKMQVQLAIYCGEEIYAKMLELIDKVVEKADQKWQELEALTDISPDVAVLAPSIMRDNVAGKTAQPTVNTGEAGVVPFEEMVRLRAARTTDVTEKS